MKRADIAKLVVALGLFLAAMPILATLRNVDQCRDGICVKIYEHGMAKPDDSMTYGREAGDILFVYRFNSRKDLIVVSFTRALEVKCRNSWHGPVDNSSAIAYGCMKLNDQMSRYFSVYVKTTTKPPARFLSLVDPTIWIDCDHLSVECSAETSAPYQIRAK